jgi:putative ABC transport system ATP-binding protein
MLLLADEPTGNLDSKNSREIITLIRKMNKELKQTVIIVTHDEDIALQCDRVITMEDGRIIRDEVIK